MNYDKPNFELIKISNEDVILTSIDWDYKDTIEIPGELEFQ